MGQFLINHVIQHFFLQFIEYTACVLFLSWPVGHFFLEFGSSLISVWLHNHANFPPFLTADDGNGGDDGRRVLGEDIRTIKIWVCRYVALKISHLQNCLKSAKLAATPSKHEPDSNQGRDLQRWAQCWCFKHTTQIFATGIEMNT